MDEMEKIRKALEWLRGALAGDELDEIYEQAANLLNKAGLIDGHTLDLILDQISKTR